MAFITPITPLVPIQPIGQSGGIERLQERSGSIDGKEKTNQSDFASFLKDALNRVEELQQESAAAGYGLITGEIQDFHTAVIAMEKASLAISLTAEVRNKIIDAYHEIMRMQM